MAPRRRLILFLALLPSLAGGCFWLKPGTRPGFARAPAPAAGGDLITLDLAVIERPLGDPFINQELWKSADELIVNLQRRDLLKGNGLRVGQIVGLTPSGLQTLLKSERYCLNPRRRIVASGKSITQMLGPVLTQASFTLVEDERKTPLTLDQARFCLEVTASITKQKDIHLEFTPKVETAERLLPFQPDLERSTWTVRIDKPCRLFPALSWDVTVKSDKLLVIGAVLEPGDTLGRRTFVDEEGRGIQRLLVLRASCASSAAATSPELDDLLPAGAPLPLALQAAGK
jgi:hypothetical protein